MGGWHPGDEPLLTESILMVRQEWRERRFPEYHVFDRQEELLARGRYVAAEELRPLMRGLGLRPATAAALRFVDRRGEVVFTVVFPGFRARGVMLVRNSTGEHLGEAVKTGGTWRVRYELRHRGRRIGAVQVINRRQSESRVTDATGIEVATIRNLGSHAPAGLPTDGEGYYLERLRPIDEPLRSVMVASVVALQAAIGSESVEPQTELFRLPLLPPMFDPLRRRSIP